MHGQHLYAFASKISRKGRRGLAKADKEVFTPFKSYGFFPISY